MPIKVLQAREKSSSNDGLGDSVPALKDAFGYPHNGRFRGWQGEKKQFDMVALLFPSRDVAQVTLPSQCCFKAKLSPLFAQWSISSSINRPALIATSSGAKGESPAAIKKPEASSRVSKRICFCPSDHRWRTELSCCQSSALLAHRNRRCERGFGTGHETRKMFFYKDFHSSLQADKPLDTR